MKPSKPLLFIALLCLFFSCSQNRKEAAEYSSKIATDSITSQFISSSAAMENGKDTSRKFIRTASLKFRVKSVVRATYAIEDITREFGGFVTYTDLTSTVDNKTVIPVSTDSSLETIYFTVRNDITLRIPNTRLDTTLKAISTLIDYLDFRIIKADDVALQLMLNKMTQERIAKNEQRLTKAIDNRGKKLKETTSAEELLLDKQEQSDQAKIANLSLQDQVNYSTVTMAVYQRQTLQRELISGNKNINAFKPGLGSRISESFRSGWEMLEEIIVFTARLWSLFLLAGVGWLVYRKLKK